MRAVDGQFVEAGDRRAVDERRFLPGAMRFVEANGPNFPRVSRFISYVPVHPPLLFPRPAMSDSSPFRALASEDDLQDALRQSDDEPVVLYKHSSTCPISAQAQDEMKSLVGADGPPVYRLVVQDSRDLSDRIAEHFSIRHETPQAIVVHDGEPTLNASHQDVTAAKMRQAAA
jgi:bacillithiol system protein YtxJ